MGQMCPSSACSHTLQEWDCDLSDRASKKQEQVPDMRRRVMSRGTPAAWFPATSTSCCPGLLHLFTTDVYGALKVDQMRHRSCQSALQKLLSTTLCDVRWLKDLLPGGPSEFWPPPNGYSGSDTTLKQLHWPFSFLHPAERLSTSAHSVIFQVYFLSQLLLH